MATISFDRQSFQIDGRRIWLVSGAIHYARVARGLWRQRIRAAKQAGLNCIETYVFWNVHEPQPNRFDFEGQADLRHFVQLVGEEGMFCILRPGPYVCAEWDFGGLPAWLLTTPDLALREANGPYLEACSRYLTAVMEQVKDLQITTKRQRPEDAPSYMLPGPIVMVQAENEWICSNREQGEGYLREIVRYLRENGCDVPINVCNNLWQRVDGAIDTWNANQHLAQDLRQLAFVQPNAPRIVTEFWPGWFDHWGGEHHTAYDAEWNLYRLAQILASGAQYNLYMFHGGTNFGFYGGRTVGSPSCHITTSYDYDAPLREAGGRGAKYNAIKRISTFASQFSQVFAHLEHEPPHAAVTPDDGEHALSVLHQRGTQGEVVFFFKGEGDKRDETRLLLPNGLDLPVPLGGRRVAWLLLNANLNGVARLTYSNLSPWAFLGRKLLVLFGPSGADGLLAIDDAPLAVAVPEGKTPNIYQHEQLTVAVLSDEQIDTAYARPEGLLIGACGFDAEDQPQTADGWRNVCVVTLDGEVQARAINRGRTPAAPKLNGWQRAAASEYLDGSSERYRPIDGPASFAELGHDFGYGWYRLVSKGTPSGSALVPVGGDRLHIYANGKYAALLGLGPGAEYDPTSLKLAGRNVVLADNLGRFNFGWAIGERKGLASHIHAVKNVKLTKPKVVDTRAPDPFEVQGLVLYRRKGDQPMSQALVWTHSIRGNKTLILDIQGLPADAVVYVNDEPLGLYSGSQTAGLGRWVLERDETLQGGRNEIRVALLAPLADGVDPTQHVKLYESTKVMTEAAEWAFAPWTPPEAEAFGNLLKQAKSEPCWYRCTFNISNTNLPLFLEPAGMTKGQILLNGHNVGRYFVSTRTGATVGPQSRYYLPEPWLNTDGPNELILFDEHGRSPLKCTLAYDRMGPYGGA